MIRTLIADDEPPAREQLREFLRSEPDVLVVGEAADGLEARRMIAELDPDLLLLDIRMPQLSGLEVLEGALPRIPYTIFTTAYASHAVEAFRLEAVDYLLKPLENARFRQAIERVRRFLSQDAALTHNIDLQALQRYIESLRMELDRHGGTARLTVKVGRTVQFIDAAMIESIEVNGDYLNIHGTVGERTRTRASIGSIEKQLPAGQFTRIHRSTIVNLDLVKELRSDKHGGYTLVMASGRLLATGAKYATNIRRLLPS